MSIRKSKRKLALCIASLFWVACGNDSSSNANIVASDPSGSDLSSSSESLGTTSSGTPTSSADAALPSSSDAVSPGSSATPNPDYPYTLGLNPSVHCKDSTVYVPSPCPSYKAKIKSTMASIEENVALYGIVQPTCTITARNDPIYICDNGMSYVKGNEFVLQENTIVQCAPTSTNGTCPSAQEYYAKIAEDAEASTKYLYKLASDTTVNCKESSTAKIVTQDIYPGMKTEKWGVEGKYKCQDGKTHEYEDLLRTESGAIYKSAE
ncbi:MAG: hypothetical protein IKN70_01350 [Fibrobacter sp.]|nr:hypothetical protein [Fibrobacter sp.]